MTDTVYLVAWLGTGVVKAGYTGRTKSRARYRAGDVVARSEQCIRAMHASIAQASASTRSTNGRTNALTLEALPLTSRYGALVTRAKGSSE